MEGGTEFDLNALDIPDPPPDEGRRSRGNSETQHERGNKERPDRESSSKEERMEQAPTEERTGRRYAAPRV